MNAKSKAASAPSPRELAADRKLTLRPLLTASAAWARVEAGSWPAPLSGQVGDSWLKEGDLVLLMAEGAGCFVDL
ncbi:hypothetical protein, partial [Mycobacterium sp. 1245852.3]|uniref:hypothetical protein n=1 Tax=Mycobacterium sp. 1245852.3 TaxID=1856860 RepID=UPI001E4AC9BC